MSASLPMKTDGQGVQDLRHGATTEMAIRRCFPADRWPEMREFLARRYRHDLALLWRPLFEWQFQSARDGGNASILTAWDGDRLVGTLGYVSVPLLWGDWHKPVNGAWAMNWMVEPDYRTGIGWSLMRKLQAMHPVVFAIDASTQNLELVGRLGWTIEPVLPRLVRVLDAARAETLFGLSPEVPRRSFTGSPTAAGGLLDFAVDSAYAPDWRLYAPLRYGTIRSREYLRWRFLEHPRFRYSVALTDSTNRPAVCAYRVELAFDRDGGPVAPVGRVLDFFHPTDSQGEQDAERLLHGVLTRMARAGCVYADFSCSAVAYRRTLQRLGWLDAPPDGPLLPSRLAPIEPTARLLNVEFGVSAPLGAPPFADAYFTTADGDADRPSMLAERMPAAVAAASTEWNA